jgi:anti-anti-sigma factor
LGPVPGFAVTTQELDGAMLLSVVGEVDMSTAPTLAEHIDPDYDAVRTAVQTLVVDLSLVPFFSSSGIAVLVEAQTRLAEKNIELRIVPSAVIRRALQLVGVAETLSLYHNLSDALPGDGTMS